jgi:hypothetical protein
MSIKEPESGSGAVTGAAVKAPVKGVELPVGTIAHSLIVPEAKRANATGLKLVSVILFVASVTVQLPNIDCSSNAQVMEPVGDDMETTLVGFVQSSVTPLIRKSQLKLAAVTVPVGICTVPTQLEPPQNAEVPAKVTV